jgi:phosphoglycolate phosphatase-like HAD superfamily hydrolase
MSYYSVNTIKSVLPHRTANYLYKFQVSYHPNILYFAELGLAEHFDFVMTSEESKAEKPNRQIFDMAMEKTKCSDPATAYHVGTSIDFDVSNFNSVNVFICVSLPHFFLYFL